MTSKSQSDPIVRPNRAHQQEYLAPIHEEVGDLEEEPKVEDEVAVDGGDVDTDARPVREKKNNKSESSEQQEWQDVREKVEDLNVRFARHFEDSIDNNKWGPPMVTSPPHLTKEELMRHQFVHAPYASWCRHCSSARAVRNKHHRADQLAKLVPDTGRNTNGPEKVKIPK